MVLFETAALTIGVYKYAKHRKHKKAREAQETTDSALAVYPYYHDTPQPSSRSTTSFAPSENEAPPITIPYDARNEQVPVLPQRPGPQALIPEGGWRPVYMLERSTSKYSRNEIRTHRAIFVGEFYGDQGTGRAHEIRKEKASILGVQVPLRRTMRYTDAEQWIGEKALDRPPVFLGHTDWTDEDLNRKGHEMVDLYPTYSLSYANCQHFVADLAEKIIPEAKMDYNGMSKTRPAFDRLLDEIETGEYEGHGDAILNGLAEMTLSAGKQTSKFFHFTKAVVYSLARRDWQPFDEYSRLLRAQNIRDRGAHSREDRRLGPRYITAHHSGESSSNGVVRRL